MPSDKAGFDPELLKGSKLANELNGSIKTTSTTMYQCCITISYFLFSVPKTSLYFAKFDALAA